MEPKFCKKDTASSISCEKGVENSLGGEWFSISSCPCRLRSFLRPWRNSSFTRWSSSFRSCETSRSACMRSCSCSSFDSAMSCCSPLIISRTCCMDSSARAVLRLVGAIVTPTSSNVTAT